MVQVRNRRKIVKPLAKGQVTIPAEFRDALGIDTETLLSISLIGDHLEIRPLRQGEEELRRYTEEEVARFVADDRLEPEVARRIKELLQQGNL
jgi:AbrB family looped-hinge helix DNA binding protein